MIDKVEFFCEDAGWYVRTESDEGRVLINRCDPKTFDKALRGWREHEAEGELVRAEWVAFGGGSWAEYHAARQREIEEGEAFWERQRELADLWVKRAKEAS